MKTFGHFWKNQTALMQQLDNDESSSPKSYMKIILFLATLFPYHFTYIRAFSLRKKSETMQDKLSETLKAIPNPDLEEDESEDLKREYAKIQRSIKETDDKFCEMIQLKAENGVIKTVLEHVPSAIVIMALWFMSYSHITLRLFLKGSFLNKFSTSYKVVILLVCLQTTLHCISSIVSLRYIHIFTFFKV